MQPFSRHAHFFSSLKHIEKRLKLENPSPSPTLAPPPPPPPPPSPLEKAIDTQIDSLSSSMYLHPDQTTRTSTNNSILQESDPPQEFLSISPDFPSTQETPFQENNEQTSNEAESSDLDDIELLMQFLGLSDEKELKRDAFGFGCDDEFYGKIVGVKGPKCVKEWQRLDGWIKHFMNGGGEKKEPLRLAHLLLFKAAFLSSLEGCQDPHDGLLSFVRDGNTSSMLGRSSGSGLVQDKTKLSRPSITSCFLETYGAK